MRLPSKLINFAHLMRLNKPIGVYLCLWPSLWALWLATNGRPSIKLLSIIIAGSIIVRSAGCIINDVLDRHFDRHVERTKYRPITSGQISVNEALVLFSVLGLLALGLVFTLGPLAVMIALAAGVLTILYPLAKRVTDFPQVVLGITFNAGILIAYAAAQHSLPLNAWILYATAILWTIAYDTMYAMADKKDDAALGLKSTALKFSGRETRIIGSLHMIVLLGFVVLGVRSAFTFTYYAGLICTAMLYIYQHILLQRCTPTHYTQAFLNNHWVGCIIFLVILLQTW